MNMKEDNLRESEMTAYNSIITFMVLPGAVFFISILIAIVLRLFGLFPS